ncbi:uncharacterized protein LOC135341467 [Halichondria panicea]|uniref:uncharacterized protein LOC135341467 n=1 Tax=Halichondria panicea TaxID=6063 RepID=UPI00312B70AB
MATSKQAVGYECKIISLINKEYFCKQCKHLAREANTSKCCKKTFCKECIETIIREKEVCPSCNQKIPGSEPQKDYQADILALKVCCSKGHLDDTQHSSYSCEYMSIMFKCMFPRCYKKVQGCEWTGELKDLDDHTTGNCAYVNVDCPKGCGKKVQKRNVETHCAKECQKTKYAADNDNLSSHENVSDESESVDSNEEIQKPQNEETDMPPKTGHGDKDVDCPSEGIICTRYANTLSDDGDDISNVSSFEFSRYGSDDDKLSLHENLSDELESVDSNEEIQKPQNEETDMPPKTGHGDKDQQTELQPAILETEHQSHNTDQSRYGATPSEIVFCNYQKHKNEKKSILSPYLEVHVDHPLKKCVRYHLTLYPNGTEEGTDSHLSLKVSLSPDCEVQLTSLKITIQLLNQHDPVDLNHFRRVMSFGSAKESGLEYDMPDIKFIPLADLELNENKRTRYLKDDCLKFRVEKAKMTCIMAKKI